MNVETGHSSMAQLPSLQRRLRHLHSVAARNISIPVKHFTPDVSLIQLYFTLHKDMESAAFYTSETTKGSLNPMWKSMSLTHLDSCTDVDTTSQSVVVRVWYCYAGGENKLCLTWDVHFAGLVCFPSQNVSEFTLSAPNTLIFGIHNDLYAAASDNTVNIPIEQPAVFEIESSLLRCSYNVRSLQRVHTVLQAIHQTQSIVKRVRQSIDSCLAGQLYVDRKRAQREFAVLKVNLLRGDLQWRAAQLRARKDAFESQQLLNLQKEVSLKNKLSKLGTNSEDLRESKKHYFDIREELIKTGAQLVLRRKQLLSELALIYPIVPRPKPSDHTICGVRLPHSEDFEGQDETMLAVALGYVCHLVAMISNVLDVPLRYPMDHQGSRSAIIDRIIDKLPDGERQFPLFGKGKEKFQFHYGVYLLNKNVAQLRHYCGMPTPDLRCTLDNISSLLCDRLGVAVSRNDAFSNQHSQIPPSFGGAHMSTVTARSSDAMSVASGQLSDTSSQLTVTQQLGRIQEECVSRDTVDNMHETEYFDVDVSVNSSVAQSVDQAVVISVLNCSIETTDHSVVNSMLDSADISMSGEHSTETAANNTSASSCHPATAMEADLMLPSCFADGSRTSVAMATGGDSSLHGNWQNSNIGERYEGCLQDDACFVRTHHEYKCDEEMTSEGDVVRAVPRCLHSADGSVLMPENDVNVSDVLCHGWTTFKTHAMSQQQVHDVIGVYSDGVSDVTGT